MVIANLDSQVEKVFGLSAQKEPAEETNHANDDQITGVSKPVTEETHESRATLRESLHAQMSDENLDETELPVWLL